MPPKQESISFHKSLLSCLPWHGVPAYLNRRSEETEVRDILLDLLIQFSFDEQSISCIKSMYSDSSFISLSEPLIETPQVFDVSETFVLGDTKRPANGKSLYTVARPNFPDELVHDSFFLNIPID